MTIAVGGFGLSGNPFGSSTRCATPAPAT